MTSFKGQLLEEQLRLLRDYSPAIEGSVISSVEGFPVATDLREVVGEEHLAARAAAIVALGERIALELRRGGLSEIFITSDNGCMVVALINEQAALTVLYSEAARMAMALLDIQYCVKQLRRLL